MADKIATEREERPMVVTDRELAGFFADAEQYWEHDRDEHHELVACRFFVRHPEYKGCTGLLTFTVKTTKAGKVVLYPKQEIIAEGEIPTRALVEVARYIGGQEAFAREQLGPRNKRKRQGQVRELFYLGKLIWQMAKELRVSEATIKRDLREMGLRRRRNDPNVTHLDW